MSLIVDGYGKEEEWWEEETLNNVAVNRSHPCFETDDPSADNTVRAQGLILQARHRRLKGRYHGGARTKMPEDFKRLDGNCVENTLATVDEGEKRGLDVDRIVVMSRRDYTEEFESAKDAYDSGFSHHLAQVHFHNPRETFIVDPSLWQSGPYTGTPYVGREVPNEYVWFHDSASFGSSLSSVESYRMEEIAPTI